MCVTAGLGKENGDRVLRGILLKDAVAGLNVTRRTTPFIGVETKEVQTICSLLAASEIVLEHGTQFGDIRSGISDRNRAVPFVVTVDLDITSCSQNKRGRFRSHLGCDNLVADEDACGVVKLNEFVEDGCESMKLSLGPRGLVLEHDC